MPGSASSNRVFALARGFAAAGRDVKMILCQGAGAPAELDKIIDAGAFIENIETVYIPNRGNKISRMKYFIRDIKKCIAQYYIQNRSVIYFYLAPEYGLFLKKYHKVMFCEETEIPFNNIIHVYPTFSKRMRVRIIEFLRKKTIEKSRGLFVISKALKEYYESKSIRNVQILNMFVDTTRFSNIKKQNTFKYIGYCGAVSRYKDGVDCLIKAFKLVLESHTDYKLLIIGPIPKEQDRKELTDIVNELGLGEKVVFTGKVSVEEMPQYLTNAEILALARPDTPQAKYGFPTKLGEYLTTGNPVVVTNVGDMGYFLKDKYNAMIAQPGNHEEFAEKLNWLIENPEKAEEIGKKGKELSFNEFSNTTQAKIAIEYMEKILINKS